MYKRKSSDKQIDEVIYKAEHDGFGLNEEELDAYMANYHFGNGANPIGTIIAFMGNIPPIGYLACDGSEYDIIDYPKLAKFFKDQFGSTQYFGGTGDKFKVPDLRGEFLRGTGTNGHTNSGNGASVGTHQDGTEFPIFATENNILTMYHNNASSSWKQYNTNADKARIVSPAGYLVGSGKGSYNITSVVPNVETVKPTNTSVLFCIASKNIYLDARFDYSLEEKVVGEWIDGKPLYQKSIIFDNTSTQDLRIDVTSLNIKRFINYFFSTGNASQGYNQASSSGNYMSGTDYLNCYLDTQTSNKMELSIRRGTYWFKAPDGVITIQYTKTTD